MDRFVGWMPLIPRPQQRLVLVGMALMIAILTSAVPALAWSWQDTFKPFYHNTSFCGTVDAGGQEDAAVVYESGQRHVWAEGSYLQWSSNAIGCLQYAITQNPAAEGAIVFHSFDLSGNWDAVQWISGWAWSNLPAVSPASYHNNGEVRFYIGDPNSMSSSQTYYAQLTFNDTAYPGSTTVGKVPEATYLVQMTLPLSPVYRDDNAVLCMNANAAYHC